MKATGRLVIGGAVLLGALMFVNSSRGATIITFDSLPNGTTVTNQFAEATFSSIQGRENRVSSDFDFGPLSAPNYIITAAVGGPLTGMDPTFVDFTNPVNNLTFLALGDNDSGVQATVDVFENNAFSATMNITVDGVFDTVDSVDLSSFSQVTRIEIDDITDGGGLAWDRFEFNTVPVPEPANIAIWSLLVGLGLALDWRRRRRRAA